MSTKLFTTVAAACLLVNLTLADVTVAVEPTENGQASQGRELFDFAGQQALSKWQIVNDGVMGGRSSSRVSSGSDGSMKFSGVLSLANNGGFASTRSRGSSLGLKRGDTIVLRVKGDGRKYTFNAYVPRRRMAFSYRVEFMTKKNQWVDVRIPLDQLVATSFGRVVRGASLNPAEVNSVGILLGDKKPGAFQILIQSIEVEAGNNGQTLTRAAN
ncbi:MAG: CIA30 family protein [Planctomycetaceae bacterium]|nr:CIA30 family protein [Planctomycetaceae bacterium]